MSLDAKPFIAFALGFGGGWAARSLADSPQGVGVKLLEVGLHTKERLERWAAVERERLEDMMAEARSRVEAQSRMEDHATVGANGKSAPNGSARGDERNET